ncbi:uncharacterized protein GGS22DRAFT_17529 [Annulohypoxylon maeteangense]|uniref:uncharacterized protein n=1 Tax=Annulohypoxylon maeteangense TaxID=1927788 RepID=UPI002008CC40|nr:uncharacterized protein GGS22DRAFT_17529 [Annulohypoxylon maeteangense]KAI0890715.1 hypothetical protein GGS22DRAFT_17529 [Annulohypoxylon maeteangense]
MDVTFTTWAHAKPKTTGSSPQRNHTHLAKATMTGLIPLLLPSSTGSNRSSPSSSPIDAGRRASVSISTSQPAPSSLVHRRQQSLPSLKTPKRSSLALPAVLPSIPFTSGEWKNAMDDVKRKYLNRKYRACSARCCEILENVKDTSTVEPLHLIYLHFYAASSFELCARPLSNSSNYRTRLLRDAQVHYAKAEELIQNTEDNVNGRTRSISTSSTMSGMNSPGLSSVRSSVSSTTFSSPRTSVCSTEDGVILKSTSRPVKAKKKVSFSGLNDLIEFQPEPYIRPDSPTLGWEEDFFPRHSNPSPYSPQFSAEKTKPASSKSEPTIETQPEVVECSATSDQQPTEESNTVDDKFDLDTFLQTKSANRICAQLSALRLQVSWHRTGIETLLAEADETPATPTIPTEAWPVPPSPFFQARFTRSNSLPVLDLGGLNDKPSALTTPGSRESFSGSPNPKAINRPASVASTIRCGDEALKQRIERLRAGGWQRKRFDSRRYEALREQVLCELGA